VVETTPVVKTIPIAIERKVEHAPMTSDDADVATTIATVDRTVAMRPTETAKTSPGLVTAHPSAARRWWWIGALGVGAAGAVAFFAMQPPGPTDDLAPTPILSASSRTTDACGGAGEACCDGGACSLATDACIDGRCLGSVTAIFAGPIQTCATRRDGTVLCWGDNAPPLIDPGGPPIVDAPVVLRNVRAPSHLAFGYEVGFAVVDGSLRGWGKNAFDLLGPSLPTEGSSSEPASVEVGVDRVTSLDVGLGGPQNACAVADGKLTCWGDSNALFGPSSERVNAVGPRPITLPPTPMPMRSVEVGVGGSQFACARRVVSGTDVTSVVCWGNATPWHLALGPAHPPVEFQVRSLIEGADLSMAVGTHSACVGWRTDVRCWERTPGCAANAGGQDLLLHRLPAPVHSMVGGMGHYCARMEADAVACWGRNHAGQTGQPASVAWVCEPTPVTFPARVSQIVVGNHHTCALTVDGHVYCLGANDRGQRGCGPEGPEHAPCRVGVPAR
jgi:hypothetical protein